MASGDSGVSSGKKRKAINEKTYIDADNCGVDDPDNICKITDAFCIELAAVWQQHLGKCNPTCTRLTNVVISSVIVSEDDRRGVCFGVAGTIKNISTFHAHWKILINKWNALVTLYNDRDIGSLITDQNIQLEDKKWFTGDGGTSARYYVIIRFSHYITQQTVSTMVHLYWQKAVITLLF